MERDDSDTPVSPGYPFREGSITGFDQIVDETVTSILTKGWSKEQLHQAILNFKDTYGKDGLNQLLSILMAHLSDFNNPHRVTIDQVTGDIIELLLAPILKGTPPSTPPIFGINPNIRVPASLLMYGYNGGLDANGKYAYGLVSPSGRISAPDPAFLPVDMAYGTPYLPLTPALTAPESDVTLTPTPGTVLGSTPDDGYHLGPSMSLIPYQADKGGASAIGFTAPITVNTTTGTSFTFFVRPADQTKMIVLTNNGNTIEFDTTANTIASSSLDFVGELYVLTNGCYRVGVTLAKTGSPTITVSAYNTTEYANPGTIAQGVIGMWCTHPVVTDTPAPIPVMLSRTTSTTASAITCTVPPAIATDMMCVCVLSALPTSLPQDALVFSLGGIDVRFNGTVFTIITNTGAQYSTSGDMTQFTKLAFSVSKTRLCMKFQNKAKVVIPGDFSSLAFTGSSFTIGNLCGGVISLALYAESDRDQMLEFLTDV